MVSPIMFMIPPPAPWLSMASLEAELKKAIQAPPQAPKASAAPPSPSPAPRHVDLIA
ncbi:MAG TPA: hypothetical protein VK457_08440 [Chloroflexota bacterium]|nr:hypothetical protein [Chloroflexota bacterium]